MEKLEAEQREQQAHARRQAQEAAALQDGLRAELAGLQGRLDRASLDMQAAEQALAELRASSERAAGNQADAAARLQERLAQAETCAAAQAHELGALPQLRELVQQQEQQLREQRGAAEAAEQVRSGLVPGCVDLRSSNRLCAAAALLGVPTTQP